MPDATESIVAMVLLMLPGSLKWPGCQGKQNSHSQLPSIAGSFQVATCRQLAASYAQPSCWLTGDLDARTTVADIRHQPASVVLWPGILALAEAELATLDDTVPLVYSLPEVGYAANEGAVVQFMQQSFFKICNLILEAEGIILHQGKRDAIKFVPVSCTVPHVPLTFCTPMYCSILHLVIVVLDLN